MKVRESARRIVAGFAAVALVFGLVPASAFAAGTAGQGTDERQAGAQRSEAEIEADVSVLLAAGDYVEGKAIVCSVDGPATASGRLSMKSAGDADLLATGEQLSAVTANQYAEATGETVPVAATSTGALSAMSTGALSAKSAGTNGQVSISLVQRDDMSTEQLLRELLADPRVLSAEPDYLMNFEDDGEAEGVGAAGQSDQAVEASQPATSTAEITYDMTGYQWFSTGAAASTPQYLEGATNPGIRVPHWNDASEQNASGVVAIMDSGVDYTHPDLAGVMYHFTAEQQAELGCGEYGYAPIREDKTDPMDYYDHGTHCAGIVAAQWNGFGVSGVANGVRLCAVSIAESKEKQDFSYDGVVKGYDFLVRAAKAGVDIRVVNCSFGFASTNNAGAAMVQAAGEAGIVTCFASGNDRRDLDAIYDDLAAKQQSPYVLRVDASRQQDDRAWFSCYGNYTTDVFSPGCGILSTIPTVVDSSWRYFPQADASPLYKDTAFEGALPRVRFGAYSAAGTGTLKELAVSKADDIGVDGDNASAKFTADVTVGQRQSIYVDVPVGSLSDAEVQDMGFALYLDSFEITGAQLSVLLEGGSYLDESANRSDNSMCGWIMAGLHVPDSPASPVRFARIDEGGQTYVRLRFDAMYNDPSMEDFAVKTVEMRLDQIAIGRKGNGAYLPYCYMNGTSMAAPVVTGSAAVVSSSVQDAASAGERAAETVRILKGAMHQTPGYVGLCKQGGQIDLGILGQTSAYVPVLESASVADGAIKLQGNYFGSERGALSVGGVQVQPSSWSETQAVATWPSGVASGTVPVYVKSGTGEACRAFMLSAPEGDPQSVALYESELTAPNLRADGLSTTACPYNITATSDGTLFAAASNTDDQMEETTGYLFRSDDAGASWTPLQLPKLMKRVSLAAADGVVYVLGATPAGELQHVVDAWHLYSLDVAAGTFTHLRDYDAMSDDAEMPDESTLAYARGNLYVVDCHDDDDGDASYMRIRKFGASYKLGATGFQLKHRYQPSGSYYAPKVSVAGGSIYVCDLQPSRGSDDDAVYGLERVGVSENGKLSCTDLSAALAGLGDDVAVEDVCLAASNSGVYLVGGGLDGLLGEGAKHADTLFLKRGAKAFTPCSKALSLAPVFTPAAVCSGGWLYAFGTSEYEAMPVFGRATQVGDSAQALEIGDTAVKGGYAYTVLSETTASVKLSASGKKTLATAKVPASVKLAGRTYKVTKVAAKGFASAKKLKSVTLGANVKTIGAGAFAGCKKLKTFKATSKALAKIGARSFKGCKKLAKVTVAKTTKLTKSGVKKCLTGSSVKTVDVKNSKKAAYKKLFTKKNCGKKVSVR